MQANHDPDASSDAPGYDVDDVFEFWCEAVGHDCGRSTALITTVGIRYRTAHVSTLYGDVAVAFKCTRCHGWTFRPALDQQEVNDLLALGVVPGAADAECRDPARASTEPLPDPDEYATRLDSIDSLATIDP